MILGLAFGSVGCDLLDDAEDLLGDLKESTSNCEAVCEIIIDDCDLTSDSGMPGESVSECTDYCVELSGGADMESEERELYEVSTCEDLETALEEEVGAPDDYPNCTDACLIVINDCELQSDSGPPGSTVGECVTGCVEWYEYDDMVDEDLDTLENLENCEDVLAWLSE